MLNARKRSITTNTPSTNGILTDISPAGTPVTDLVPQRYQVFRKKFHTFSFGSNNSSQAQGQIRVHRVRHATSSFWSPPPPPELDLEEQGYQDFLPPNVDVDLENRQTAAPGEFERSLSDESETIRGTIKGPLSPVSPTSADTLLKSPLQRPASIYDGESQMVRSLTVSFPLVNPYLYRVQNSSLRQSTDVRPLSKTYPWHAR